MIEGSDKASVVRLRLLNPIRHSDTIKLPVLLARGVSVGILPRIQSKCGPDCPHCIDEFRFDYQKIAKLTYGWRVRVRCPGCGNIVEVVMLNYQLIHGCDPDKYKPGETVEILRPDPNLSNDWWMTANTVRRKILEKKSGWRPQG